MPRRFVLGAVCALVSVLAACEVPVVDTAGVGTPVLPAASTAPAGSVIAGIVRVFPRDVAASSSNGEALTLASLEAPVVDTEVALLDAGLKPIANAPKVRTDAGGRFELTGLPLGRTFVLEVKLPDGRPLRTLIATVPGGEQVTISEATTILAAMLLADLKDVPPAHDPRAFARLAHEVALFTTPAEFELFREDRQLAAKVGAIAAGSKEVWDLLVGLKRDVTAAPATTADVAAQIVPASPRPSGTATPAGPPSLAPSDPAFPDASTASVLAIEPTTFPELPTPTPEPATPTPTPTRTPTPAPTATPTPTPAPTATPNGSFVRTFAGTGTAGSADGATPSFSGPIGLALRAGKLWVGDTANQRIRELTIGSGETAAGTTTLAGGSVGLTNGTGAAAQFNSPEGLAWSPDGSKLLVADALNERIRIVTAAGVVTTLRDAAGAELSFVDAADVVFADADTAYVSVISPNRIMKLTFDANGRAAATVHAGSSNGDSGFADGAGATARFRKPRGLAINADGVLFVADSDNNRIRRIAPDGTTTTIAGSGTRGFLDGATAVEGRFDTPSDVAVGGDGAIYVADTFNNRIRKISGSGTLTLTTLAGTGASTGERIDGPVAQATFRGPRGIVVDGTRVYVADTDNHSIRLISLQN